MKCSSCNYLSCCWRAVCTAEQTLFSRRGKVGLFSSAEYFIRVFAHYFTVGFSLYSENKVIIYIFFLS